MFAFATKFSLAMSARRFTIRDKSTTWKRWIKIRQTRIRSSEFSFSFPHHRGSYFTVTIVSSRIRSSHSARRAPQYRWFFHTNNRTYFSLHVSRYLVLATVLKFDLNTRIVNERISNLSANPFNFTSHTRLVFISKPTISGRNLITINLKRVNRVPPFPEFSCATILKTKFKLINYANRNARGWWDLIGFRSKKRRYYIRTLPQLSKYYDNVFPILRVWSDYNVNVFAPSIWRFRIKYVYNKCTFVEKLMRIWKKISSWAIFSEIISAYVVHDFSIEAQFMYSSRVNQLVYDMQIHERPWFGTLYSSMGEIKVEIIDS